MKSHLEKTICYPQKMPAACHPKKFSWRARAKSFVYAWQGILSFFKTEHNAFIHVALTLAAFVLSFALRISKTEFLFLLLTIVLVWMAEIFNTAIEKSMDFISTEKHPQIKLVKDLAAAAVLISAMAALLVAIIIFCPKLYQYV